MYGNIIHKTAFIGNVHLMGKNIYIGPYSVIGSYPEHKSKWMQESKPVLLSSNVIITGMCSIDAGIERDTVVMEGAFLMKHSHVGHDALIGTNVVIACGAKVGGHSTVCEQSNIGLNASIHQRKNVGVGSMVGMNTPVTKSIELENYDKVVGGSPRVIGSNRDRFE